MERRRKFHAFNKKKSFILLRHAHFLLYFTQLLCYTFYNYMLFIIIFIRLSLLSFLCKFILFFRKFVLLYLRALFFSSILRYP